MRRFWILAILPSVLSACSHVPGAVSGNAMPLRPSPYRLAAQLNSALPDDYYVMSGPGRSYARVRFNAEFAAALSDYARRKSDPEAVREAQLLVRIETLRTDYSEEGRNVPLGPGRKLRLASSQNPREGSSSAMTLLGDSFFDQDSSIPAKIMKSVRLTISTELRRDGEQVRRETFVQEASETIDREHYDRWAYDYDPLLREVIGGAIVRLDGFVERVLGAQENKIR